MWYVCTYCKVYVYDTEAGDQRSGLAPETSFKEIPDDWLCPICGQPKSHLQEISEDEFNQKSGKSQELASKRTAETTKKTLAYYRSIAREMLVGLCSENKVCDGHPDRTCMGQKYGAPLGFGAAGQGMTFHANFLSLQAYKFKMTVVKDHFEPDMTSTLFNHDIVAPVMNSSISGVKASMNDVIKEEDFYRGLLKGSQAFGAIGLVGNTAAVPDTLGIDMVRENGGHGIAVFKPQAQERLFELFKIAEDSNAIAIGVDLDGCGSAIWAARGKPVYRKNESELKELVDCTEKPVLFKGIMTVEDAMRVLDSGAAAVYVSNHGGRVLDYGQGVGEVLPAIAKACKKKIAVLADGAIRTGFDVLKVLAMGADAAFIGRPLARMSLAGGAEAVEMYLNYVKGDLRRAMIMTGCATIKDATMDILVKA
jgi:isopentenyl diphosphate isomerase/L-lactate dehydrogenase-like FMN-dependent dehydrogenase/rubredoxin